MQLNDEFADKCCRQLISLHLHQIELCPEVESEFGCIKVPVAIGIQYEWRDDFKCYAKCDEC